MTKKQKILTIVTRFLLPSLITALWLSFIYGNSLKTGVESSEASGLVHRLVNTIPELLGLGSPISEHFVRKAAHFTEFAILGILVCSDLWCFSAVSLTRPFYLNAPILAISVPICAFFASLDEYLQGFVDGRGPSVTDVLIDTSGAFVSTIFFILIFGIIWYTRKKIQSE